MTSKTTSTRPPGNTRPATDVSTRTLPASFYTDPTWHQQELERIHLEMWLYAGRADRIASPGAYFLFQIADAEVLILRDEQGQIRAFHNVCRHRGTRLCHEGQGQLPGRIRCPYHAWTYRLDGTLAQAPHMEKVLGFAQDDYPLGPVAVASWAGNIFVNLSANPLPFSEHLAGLDVRFANYAMDELRAVERRSYQLRANWKLIVQNYHECLHCPTAHPQFNRLSHYLSGDNEPPQPTYLGSRMDLREGITTLSTSEQPRRAPLARLDAEQRRSVYYYAILPNLLLNLHPDYVVTYRFDPRAVDRTDVECEWLFHESEVNRPGFDPSDAVEFWDVTNRQDWELSDQAQAGIGSRGYRPGPYSNREELLAAFDRWVLSRVGQPPATKETDR
jgi:glycine betaine catabolism A